MRKALFDNMQEWLTKRNVFKDLIAKIITILLPTLLLEKNQQTKKVLDEI